MVSEGEAKVLMETKRQAIQRIADGWDGMFPKLALKEALGEAWTAALVQRKVQLKEMKEIIEAGLDANAAWEMADHAIEERDGLISLLQRISTDIAQTVIEDPVRAAEGWAMLSKPVIQDIQVAIEPYTNAASVVVNKVTSGE